MEKTNTADVRRNLLIAGAIAAFSVSVFMTGIVNYGHYQQAHRIKYLPSAEQ